MMPGNRSYGYGANSCSRVLRDERPTIGPALLAIFLCLERFNRHSEPKEDQTRNG